VTTALRRSRLETSPAATGLSDAAGREARPRLSVTWPLTVLFVAFPIWWALGLSGLIWTVLPVPMLVALIWRQRTRAPVAALLWFAFVSWALMSGLQLESGTKILTFTYRLALYAGAGVLFLYVYNLPRSSRLDVKVLRILTLFWMVVVAGGYVGMLVGSHAFTAPLEYLLPHALRNQPFVQELVQPVFGTVENFLGFPVTRPAAPFPYTNDWGGNIAVLTPVAFAAMAAAGPGLRRKVIVGFLVASIVPMVVSLNRGMFLSLAVGVAYVAIRLALRGRVTALVSLLGLLTMLVVIVAVTPLGHLVIANISSTHGHSNATRLSVTQQSITGANQSPIFGHGEPQAVTGQGGTPPIGSQGQLWMVLYSNGYVATVLFVGFFLAVLWQTRRATSTAALWLHAVPLIALAHSVVYGWLPAELQVVMVIAALAYRRCWRTTGQSVPSGSRLRPPGRTSPGRTSPRRRSPRPLAGGRSMSSAADEPGGGLSPAAAVVVRGSLVNLVAMVAGAVMSFGLVVLVSRWLQPRGAGPFFELIALFTILSNTLELGADTGLTRWISRARAIGGMVDVRRIVTIAITPVALVGTAAAVAMWVTAPQIAHIFLRGLAPAAGTSDIRIIAPLVPLGALSACVVDGLRGFGRMWPYLALEGIGKPAARIGLVAAALVAGLGLRGATVGWGLPVVAGLVLGCVIFTWVLRKEAPVRSARGMRHRTPIRADDLTTGPGLTIADGQQPWPDAAAAPRRGGRAEFPVIPELDATVELPVVFDPVVFDPVLPVASDVGAADRLGGLARALEHVLQQEQTTDRGRHRGSWRPVNNRSRHLAAEFWAFTGPRAFQATFQVVILWLDILIVAALTSAYQAGIYSAVSKLAIVGTFALEANRLAIAPQLSALLARHQLGRAADLYQSATRWLMLASWPLYLVFALFPAVVLGIFGSRYTAGASALAVLSLAMLVNLGTGNVTVVLLMGGKSSWSALNAGAALIVNVGLNLLLVPRIGILGAAIAWAAAIVVDNVTAMVEVRWVLGLAPFGPGYWLAAGATVSCFGVTGIVVRLILGQTLPALGAAVAAGLAAFALALFMARVPLQLSGLAGALRPSTTRSAAGRVQRGAA
jgi:O-antigen/teichoic acid export membrane protein